MPGPLKRLSLLQVNGVLSRTFSNRCHQQSLRRLSYLSAEIFVTCLIPKRANCVNRNKGILTCAEPTASPPAAKVTHHIADQAAAKVGPYFCQVLSEGCLGSQALAISAPFDLCKTLLECCRSAVSPFDPLPLLTAAWVEVNPLQGASSGRWEDENVHQLTV